MRSIIRLAAFASLAFGAPSLEVDTTPLQVSADVTDDSSLTVHILRTDDLLSHDIPHHTRSPILERLTHVELRVSLDKEDGLFIINDEKIDLSGLVGNDDEHRPRHVQAVKAQAFSLAHTATIDGKVYTSEELATLAAEQLPAGIIGTEVTVVEDELEDTALAQPAEEESREEARVSMKSYSVFVRITEDDDVSIPNHKDVSHDSTILIPVLQVSLTIDDDSGKPVKMQAISVRPVRRPLRADRRPKGSRKRPSFDRRPHHEHDEDLELDSRPQRQTEEHASMGRRPSRGEGSRRPRFGDEAGESRGPPSHRRPPPPPGHDGPHPPPPRDGPQTPPRDGPGPPRSPHGAPRGPPSPFFDNEDHDEDFGSHRHHHEDQELMPHHRFEHHGPPHHGPPAFVRWIAQRLGITPPPRHPHRHYLHHHHEGEEELFGPRGGRPHRRPHHSEEGAEHEPFGEDKSPRQRSPHRGPSSEEFDPSDEAVHDMVEGDRPSPSHSRQRRPSFDGPRDFDSDDSHPPFHHHRHHPFHHGPPHRLTHRFHHFFHSASFLAEGIALSPFFFLLSSVVKIAIGAFVLVKLGKGIKRRVKARREGRLMLQEEQDALESSAGMEKEVLPRYADEEVAVQGKV